MSSSKSLMRRGKSGPKVFMTELGRTSAGSVRVRFLPAPPLRSFYGVERQVSAAIYALAAALEMALSETGARWAVSPYAFEHHLDLEVEHTRDQPAAEALVVELLDQLGY